MYFNTTQSSIYRHAPKSVNVESIWPCRGGAKVNGTKRPSGRIFANASRHSCALNRVSVSSNSFFFEKLSCQGMSKRSFNMSSTGMVAHSRKVEEEACKGCARDVAVL